MPAKKKIDVVVPAKAKPAAKIESKPAPAVTPKATPAKPAARKPAAKSPAASKVEFSPEQRFRWINEAAYFLAERSGFQGDSLAYWAAAEKQFEAEFG